MAVGAVAEAGGALSFVVGLTMILAAEPGDPLNPLDCVKFLPSTTSCGPGSEDVGLRDRGVAVMVTGIALAAAGTPLIVYGAKRVRAESAVPIVSVGAQGIRLKWSF